MTWQKKKLSNLTFWEKWRWNLWADMGSEETRISVGGRGMVISEPTLVAIKKRDWREMRKGGEARESIAFGMEAKAMRYKEPEGVEVVAPLSNEGVVDYVALQELIGRWLRIINSLPTKSPRVMRPYLHLSVPAYYTNLQMRALIQLWKKSGIGKVEIVNSLTAGASGLGLLGKSGLVLVEIGNRVSRVGILGGKGGIVSKKMVNWGGKSIDQAVANFMRLKYGVTIGMGEAERVKIQLNSGEHTAVIRGKKLDNHMIVGIRVNKNEIDEAAGLAVAPLMKAIKELVLEAPPDLANNVSQQGIAVFGGGVYEGYWWQELSRELKIPLEVFTKTQLAVIDGLVKMKDKG